jgi:hypothetical protein
MIEVHDGTRGDQGRASQLAAPAEEMHGDHTCYDGGKVQYTSHDDVEKLFGRWAIVARNVRDGLLEIHVEGPFGVLRMKRKV